MPQGGVMEMAGGYRLVRKLGEGDRADVWLGHAGSDDRAMAVKVYRSWVNSGSIGTELEALTRATSRHLLNVEDVGADQLGRPCLVFPRLAPGGLAKLVAIRSVLEPGEVVTAVAPIVGAVAELHRNGVVHGAIRLSSVLIDQAGAPVLAAFGRAAIVGPASIGPGMTSLTPAQQESDTAILQDRQELWAVVAGLLGRCAHSAEARSLLGWMELPEAAGRLTELEDRLFDLAPAAPLAVTRGAVRGIPQRVVAIAVPAAGEPLVAPRPAWVAGLGLPAWIESAFDVSQIMAISRRLRALLGTVRRPVWFIGAAGLLALVIALAVIPSGSGTSASTEPRPSPSPSSAVTVTSEDPAGAAAQLLVKRAGCFDQLSAICLDGVDQAGSTLLANDRAAIGRLRQGDRSQEAELRDRQPRLIQQLGDSAIIGLDPRPGEQGAAVTMLLVRLEPGWRVRDLIVN